MFSLVVNKMDSLFLMQRYWGSDEEDNNEENKNNSNYASGKSDKLQNKKKKMDSSIYEIDTSIQTTNDLSSSNCIENVVHKTLSLYETCDVENKILSKKEKKFQSKEKKQGEKIKFQESNKLIAQEMVSSGNKGNSICDLSEEGYKLPNEKDPSITEKDSRISSAKKTKNISRIKTPDGEKRDLSKKGNKLKSQTTEKEQNVSQELNIPNSIESENSNQNFCTIGKIQHEKDIKVRHALPGWLSNPTYIGVNLLEEETPISELNYLDSNTKKNLDETNINFLFPVQLAVIPWLMRSKEQSLLIRPSDICVSAPTGSGKTLAFVLPIVQSLKDRVVCSIRALVVLPVSELAIQVYKVFETFIRGTDLKVALLTGQKSFVAEQNALVRTNGQKVQSLVDIVVTTPGRIYDHIYRTKGFCLKRLQYLVIDEADRMLEEIQQGWLKQVEDAVFNNCVFSNCVCGSMSRISYEPSSAYNFGLISQPLQKLLYSATLTHDPEQLHSLSLYKPKLFTASSSTSSEHFETCTIPPGLKMLQIVCEGGIKPMVISHFIKHHNFKRVLCFTETVERAHRLHLVLEEMGLLQVREISSFNRAIQRKIVLEQFSSGKVDILVCSDLVARGIDIEDIDCVISYDVPQSIKIYIHRIGRTARAGKTGTAVTLLSEGEITRFKKMLKSVQIGMPEKVNINSEDLKPLVSSYQAALGKADTKLRNEKNQFSGRSARNMKRKRE